MAIKTKMARPNNLTMVISMPKYGLKTFDITVAKDGGTARLDIYGVITSDPWDDNDVSANGVIKAIQDMGKVDRLDIHIHSPGGSVYEGLAILTALRGVEAERHTYVDGAAASMAANLVFVATKGNKHIATNAWIMIHLPRVYTGGTADELRKVADQTERLGNQMANLIAEGTNMSLEEVTNAMKEETWYTAEEALANGFADVIEDSVEFDIAARMEGNEYSHVPERLMERNKPVRRQPPDKSTEEVDKMTKLALTLAMLMTEYPDVFTEAQATVIPSDDIAKAEVKAVGEERQRIQDVFSLAQSHKGLDDIIMPLAFDGKTTKAEAALICMEHFQKLGVTMFDKAKADANGVVEEDGTGEDGSNGSKKRPSEDEPAERAEWDWEHNHDGVREGPNSFLNKKGFLANAKGEAAGRVHKNVNVS